VFLRSSETQTMPREIVARSCVRTIRLNVGIERAWPLVLLYRAVIKADNPLRTFDY
jgi:hypothetical protein